ncbi:MAG: hypothetical protein H5T63_03535, partial [Chloroflexi bacterium]|nr:hypothetical protein [Chloroflexota bacterium]
MNPVDNYWYVLNFLNENYKAKYAEFIYALADWLAANPTIAANIGWIEMGVGLESETQPVDIYKTSQANIATYYLNYAPGGENPPGWTSNDWTRFVNWCTDLYVDAFRVRNPSLSSIPIFLNCAPEFKGKDNKSNREAFTTYAAVKGIGLKNNGLQADRSPAALYDPLIKWGSVVATTTVPIAWETYSVWLTNTTTLYWGVLCALDKHPDVLEPTRDLLVDGNYNPRLDYLEIWRWAEPYFGVTPDTTPGIWCALRETQTGGEPGNFFFWLFQNDNLSGGRTVALKPYVYSSDAWLLATGKEGAYTRRTDRATGNPYIHFQVLNPSPFYGNPNRYTFTVTVTYLDRGTDQWRLTYDSFSGPREAGRVTKTNTNAWKKATFVLSDARFGNGYTDNGMGGGIGSSAADLTIDCLDSGDEYIHMVEIRRICDGPSPTPTPTTVACTLRGCVTLQGRPTPPNPRWSVPLTVTVGSIDYAVTTDVSGCFTVTGLTPGTYDIRVKNTHTLSNIRRNYVLAVGMNEVQMGELKEGDANNSDRVDSSDFLLLRSSYLKSIGQPGYNPNTDFNEDGIVNSSDFLLLRWNYFRSGPIELSTAKEDPVVSLSFAQVQGTVSVFCEPHFTTVSVGTSFDLDIRVDAGAEEVVVADLYLRFDPNNLEVLEIHGGQVLPMLAARYDNSAGT